MALLVKPEILMSYMCYDLSTKTLNEPKKNSQNALWQTRNSQDPKFCILDVLYQPQRVLAREELPRCEIRVVAVRENNHNAFWPNLNVQNASWSFPLTATTRCEVSRTELWKVSVSEQFKSSVTY
jgi:hypothetical protein